MDTSKEYIKMCEKVPKEMWQKVLRRYGTYIVWRSFLGIVVPSTKKRDENSLALCLPETRVLRVWLKDNEDLIVLSKGFDTTDEGIILYNQDQLQKMHHFKSDGVLAVAFARFVIAIKADDCVSKITNNYYNSMEQLWLAFVMKEKYSKTWNGTDWIKIEDIKEEIKEKPKAPQGRKLKYFK